MDHQSEYYKRGKYFCSTGCEYAWLDHHMENNTQFKITYYSNKDKKHITRNGKWTDKCRYWTSKQGAKLMTYFDMDADNYRTAKGSWKVRL